MDLSYYERNAEKIKARSRKRYQAKKTEVRAQQASYRAAKGKDWVRDQNLQRIGMTLEQYNAMLEKQDGVCAICGGPPGGRWDRFHADHDHKTGEARGLLCHGCNTGIGNLKDDPEILEKAAAYLRRTRE